VLSLQASGELSSRQGGFFLKLYTDDRIVPYKSTTINPMSTKAEIDGLLARFGIRKTAWEWDIENNKVSLSFQISEMINERLLEPVVKVEPPRIWNRGNRKRREEINWAVSMRVMFWFMKSHLEMAYLLQSGKTTEFLPYIQTGKEQTLKDLVIPRLDELKQLAALPEPKNPDSRIVDVPKTEEVETRGL
jgi:hypothetical protein